MFAAIVVGTDGSQTARRAVAVAAGLARELGVPLHLVHGYLDPSSGPGEPRAGLGTLWQRSSDAILQDALADPALEGVDVQVHSVAGSAHEAIVGVATRLGAGLIVVGNRGFTGSRGPGDSVPDHVLRAAPCHVLVAKTT